MNNYFLLLFVTALWGCSSGSQKNSDATAETDSGRSFKQGNIDVTDESKYAASFIDELVAAKYEQPVKLTGDYLIAGTDTISFPTDLALNKLTIFVGNQDNRHYTLEITRINNTSVDFKFELTDNDKTLYSQAGEATLGALFFLGAESDEDENQEAYEVIQYTMNDSASNCFFSARVETGAAKGKQRAKVSYGCNDTSKPALALEEGPVLKAQ
ncbi:MAG: hypothetical protein WAQ28_09370 [Bacteroidia bacterium]